VEERSAVAIVTTTSQDMCGFNLAGLKHLQRENELNKEDQTVFTDISHQPHSNKNRKKRHRQ
jgi:hypothetical protein